MILSTVPGIVVLGCSGIRAVSRFSSATLADLAMRGFVISFLTLARVALPGSFLLFLCIMHPLSHRDGRNRAKRLRSGSLAAETLSIGDDLKFSTSTFLAAKSCKVDVELLPLILSKTLNLTIASRVAEG